ncbi:MAG TPA: DUF2148 domain-containing protein [Chloroflexota bacterium]|nr:DUF2148 domain-containing protein [Chloroflexota bacterium]
MARADYREAEGEAVRLAACLMAAAARTAPKTRGVDSVRTMIVDGEDLEVLAAAMEAKVGEKAYPLSFFARDAENVRNSAAVLLLGVTGEPKKPETPLNCGACGNPSCAEFIGVAQEEGEDYRGPLCFFQSIDLGIALGSAVKVASELNVDNRIMYTIGAAARKAGFLKCDAIIGIPLSVSRKNPYFDRP